MTTKKTDSTKQQSKDRTESYGDVLNDGTIIEAAYDSSKCPSCYFIVFHPAGRCSIATFYVKDGRTFHPPQKDRRKLDKGIIVLPSDASEYESPLSLLRSIEDLIKRCIDLPPFFNSLIANYVMMSYAWSTWEAIPYLKIQGQPGTGKTRVLDVTRALSYRSLYLGTSPTRSVLFRSVDLIGGTTIIDDVDTDDDYKSGFIQLLNAGYMREGVVSLSESAREKLWEPETFSVGGPKIITNRYGFKDKGLETRCLTIPMIARRKLSDHIQSGLPPDFKSESSKIRNQLLKWRFDSIHSINKNEHPLKHLEPRAKQVALPLYRCSPDIDFQEKLVKFMEERDTQLREDDPPKVVVEAMAELVETIGHQKMRLQQISNIAKRKGEELDIHSDAFTPKKVACISRSLGFTTFKLNQGLFICSNPSLLNELCDRFQISGDDGDAIEALELAEEDVI